ncbi:hypothetical protein MAR_021718, partial [Mya arenaria]
QGTDGILRGLPEGTPEVREAQPLPPVGAQGHGRGLSANYRDGMDDMPMVGGQKKSLPPIEANSGEDAE